MSVRTRPAGRARPGRKRAGSCREPKPGSGLGSHIVRECWSGDGGWARFHPRAHDAKRSFRGRGSTFLGVSGRFSKVSFCLENALRAGREERRRGLSPTEKLCTQGLDDTWTRVSCCLRPGALASRA